MLKRIFAIVTAFIITLSQASPSQAATPRSTWVAIVNFAVDYATQVEYDYTSFVNAYNQGVPLY